jgi:hypothetical protein
MEGVESEEAKELILYIESDNQLYTSRVLPIYKNLSKKKLKGVYDPKLAVKLFMYLVDEGAKKYAKEHATPAQWNTIFPRMVRLEAAEYLETVFEDKFQNKEFDFMKASNELKLRNLVPSKMKKEAGNAAAPYSPSVHFMGRGPGRLVWEKK